MDIRSKHLSSEDRGVILAEHNRGSNENTNGLLRQYMPKGTDLNGASQTWLNDVANLMNNRPRKTLGWRTPTEAMADESAAGSIRNSVYEAHPNHQFHRKRLRHRAESDPQDQGLPEPQNGSIHGFQADDVSQEKMAKAQRHQSTARSHSRG
jgi:hypothetical protein